MNRLEKCLEMLGMSPNDVSKVQGYIQEGNTEAGAVRKFIGDIDAEVMDLANRIEQSGGQVVRRAQLEQRTVHEQRVPTPESDELTLLYGRVEDELQEALREGDGDPYSLTTERLSQITGAPKPRKGKETTLDADVRPRSYAELVSMLKWSIKNDHEGDWYRSFGKGFAELVGEANLQEASILFGITSSQNAAEQNFADTLHIMALARRIDPIEHEVEFRQAIRDTTRPDGQHLKISGQQINKIVDMYKTGTYSGGLKVSNYMQVIRARGKNLFTPWSVQDVHMARVFGWMKKDYKVDKKGNKTVVDAAAFPSGGAEPAIRYAQWMTTLLAREHNITPDQAQAYLWFYGKNKLSPKQGKTLGDGTFKSAMNYAAGDVAEIRRMVRTGEFDQNKPLTQALGRDQPPRFQSSTQIDPYNNVDPLDALEELASARAPRVLVSTKPGTARGYGFPEGTPLRRLRMYHQAVLDAITDGQGQIKLLTEMRIPHRVRNTIGTWEGLEPSFEIVLPGESLDTAKMVATVLGDALMQDAAVTAQPKWEGTQFGIAVRKPDGSEFTDQELAEVLDAINPKNAPSGLQFTTTGDKTGLKLTDPVFYDKGEEAYTDQDYDTFAETVTKALGENYIYEHFTQEGDYVDLTRTGQKDRSEIWDQGGLTGRPDLQRTAVRDLYYPAWQVYREFRDYRFHLPHEEATDSPLSGIREGGYPARDPEADGQWNRRAGLPIREDGQVPLTHWSTTPGLTELDPNFYGTGAAGREQSRTTSDYWVNRTYYGLPGYRVEGSVQAVAKTRYFGTVDAGDLYDLNGDPLGFYHQARSETTNQANRSSRIEQLIKEAGFKGYWALGQLPAVAMFEPLEVKPIDRGVEALWEPPPRVAPFDTSFEHELVALDDLKGYEAAHAPERAIPFLKETAEGNLPPRRPPSVRLEADGSMTVLDGRSGVTAAKALGYNRVPVRVIDTIRDPKTGKVHRLRSKKAQATLESIYDQAARDKDKFDKKVEKLAEEFSGYPLIAVLKGRRKAVEKIRVDYKGDPTKIHDILRATLVIGSAKEAARARARIEQEFDVVGKSRDLFNDKTWPNGYQDMKFNVRMNGNVYELQVNTPEMLIAKEVYGHQLYDQEVKLDQAWAENKIGEDEYVEKKGLLTKAQAKVYGYAKEAHRSGVPLDKFEAELHRRAVKALDELNAQWTTGISFKNSSRETSAPFLNDLAELYRSGGNTSYRNAKAQPGPDTTTGIPSTSKNLASSGNSTIINTSSKMLSQSAWHGNGRPEMFDRFSTEHIGTGEGAQAYGWGLYFASKKKVAEWYKEKLSRTRVTVKGSTDFYKLTGGKSNPHVSNAVMDLALVAPDDFDETRDSIVRGFERTVEADRRDGAKPGNSEEVLLEEAIRVIGSLKKGDVKLEKGGRLYKVELAPEEDEYLLWDKPLSEQSEKVREALDKLPRYLDMDIPSHRNLIDQIDHPPGGVELYGGSLIKELEFAFRGYSLKMMGRGGGRSEAEAARHTSEVLHSLGIRGIKYLDGSSRGNGEGDYNYVIFSDEDVTIKEVYQQGQNSPRGGYQPVDQGHIIRMFEAADLSTFMHEAGHLFLQLELSTGSEDTQRILNWLGAPTVDDVLVRPGEEISDTKRAYHEKWARGFEAYLMEGRAPSPELQGAFTRMKAWLTSVYESLAGFLKAYGVELNDDIRGVFDRLLATKEEIAQAEIQNNYAQEFFRDQQSAGMTDVEWEDYQNRRKRATDKANSTLVGKLYRELKKRTEKVWKAEFEKEQDKAKKDLLEEPLYAARQFFRGPKTEDHSNRLNTDLVKAAFDGQIPRELKGMTHRDSSISPDDAAVRFGYKTGVEFLNAMVSEPTLEDASFKRASDVMHQRHGDMLHDGSIYEEAQEAAHNIERGKLILTELRALNRQTGGKGIDRAALKEQAERMIRGIPLGKLRPEKYHRAEVRAAQAAAKSMAQGDLESARGFKLQQAANFYLWRSANNARTRRDMIRRQIMKAKRSKMTNVAPEYRARIKAYLMAYEFNPTSEEARARARESLAFLATWMKKQTTDTFEIQTYDRNLDSMLSAEQVDPNQIRIRNYREMTLDELEGVYEQLKHLRHMGREMSDEGRAKIKQKASFLGTQLLDTFKGKKKPAKGSRLEAFIKNIKGYGANVLLNADTILRYLDGFKDEGAWYTAIKRPIDDAVTKVLLPMQQKAGDEISALYNKYYTHEELRKMNKEERIAGRMMSKWQKISLALNWGNEGNREAVLKAMRGGELDFTDQQVREVLDSLEKRDWDFVQEVWDYIETYRDALFEVARKRNGVPPRAIKPSPVKTKFGTYRGGYYHLKYDPKESWWVTEEQASEMMKGMMLGRFAKPHTPDGALKERVGSGGRPVWLDMSVFHQQINDAIMTIALAEPITNVQALLSSKEVREAMSATDNLEMLRGLDMWLKDTATGEIVAQEVVNRSLRRIRTGFSASKLGWNFGTILLQYFGILQSMPVIGYGNMINGLVKLALNPAGKNSAIKQIRKVSPFMAERGLTFNKDIHDTLTQMKGNPNHPGFWPEWMRDTMFAGIVFTQSYVDAATWLGAYEKFKNENPNSSEDDRIHYADRAVARAQASGIWSDRTPIERGTISPNVRQTELVRIWTTLGSYFFAKGNIAVELTAKTNFRDPKQVFRYVVDMLVLFSVEAVLTGMLKGYWPDDEDDDAKSKTIWVMNETLESMLTTLPFFREIGSEFSGFRGGSVLSQFAKELGEAKTQIGQGELDMALIKSLNDVGGILFKYPSSATNRVIESAYKQSQGEDVSPIDYLMHTNKQ